MLVETFLHDIIVVDPLMDEHGLMRDYAQNSPNLIVHGFVRPTDRSCLMQEEPEKTEKA
jgi:hypothetical protein